MTQSELTEPSCYQHWLCDYPLKRNLSMIPDFGFETEALTLVDTRGKVAQGAGISDIRAGPNRTEYNDSFSIVTVCRTMEVANTPWLCVACNGSNLCLVFRCLAWFQKSFKALLEWYDYSDLSMFRSVSYICEETPWSPLTSKSWDHLPRQKSKTFFSNWSTKDSQRELFRPCQIKTQLTMQVRGGDIGLILRLWGRPEKTRCDQCRPWSIVGQ